MGRSPASPRGRSCGTDHHGLLDLQVPDFPLAVALAEDDASLLMRDGLRQRGPVLLLDEGAQMRLTHRTARMLEGVARHPGASNRVVGECAGISDKGQVSKLLARLEALGLIENTGQGFHTGQPNVWTLTDRGAEVERAIGEQSVYVTRPRRAAS